MLYYLYEMQRLWAAPVQLIAEGAKVALNNPFNPWSHTPAGRIAGSAVDLVGHFTQRYGKPDWGIEATEINGKTVPLTIETAIERTYCDLIYFKRQSKRNDPKLLICAPLSGHFATLVRGTVEAMLPDHDVYVTDWRDCGMIPPPRINSISMTTSITSSIFCISSGRTPMCWRCASRPCRHWRQPPSCRAGMTIVYRPR